MIVKTRCHALIHQMIPIPAMHKNLFVPTSISHQNSHTYQNRNITIAKNPSHTFHPTPVFSAILNILFIVPFNLPPAFPNCSFIFSANAELSLISSPIRIVISFNIATLLLISPTAPSFWLSNESSTAVLYPFLSYAAAAL